MTTQSNQQGSIFILPQAIKTVARNAALQSYGVISLAPANPAETVSRFFKKEANVGILVETEEDGVSLEINLIVEYGLRIPDVALQVQEKVKEAVETATGLAVIEVNVHVQGVGFSQGDTDEELRLR